MSNEQEQKPPEEVKKKAGPSVNMEAIKGTLINYIVPLLSIAGVVLIVLLVLLPSYKALPDLEKKLDQNKKLEATLSSKLGNLNKLVDFKKIVEENSDLVNKVLVSEGLVPGLLTQVDRIARDSGLTVNRLNYGLRGTTTGLEQQAVSYNLVTINMDATGSFAQLKTFMKDIENAARVVIIENYRFSLNDAKEDNKLGMSFVLESPYLFVESNAITDDPVNLDISDPKFLNLINKIKSMKYYDPYAIDISVPVEETPAEEAPAEEGQPVEEGQPAAEQPATEVEEEALTGSGSVPVTP